MQSSWIAIKPTNPAIKIILVKLSLSCLLGMCQRGVDLSEW